MQNTLPFENAEGEREEESSTEFKTKAISFSGVLNGEPISAAVY
ncbi:hypothetical protein PN498_17100 [Oscillatoria sp. CS-180]|nr:hypothetical protein [Oscillatoria sp. CS-180]MDB9527715.1 hypothetical protein [Oscillatoria sp. CS-180]